MPPQLEYLGRNGAYNTDLLMAGEPLSSNMIRAGSSRVDQAMQPDMHHIFEVNGFILDPRYDPYAPMPSFGPYADEPFVIGTQAGDHRSGGPNHGHAPCVRHDRTAVPEPSLESLSINKGFEDAWVDGDSDVDQRTRDNNMGFLEDLQAIRRFRLVTSRRRILPDKR
ncbi:hypothetical protein DOTSEDRAFT_27149 [Dothistroma septosporum NZE10]|uniref:Uncharacterized protein n=1 Tax=Dothistroma septosporum (strain NZE10 / CBS 128990) TaxID=675120 RepID=N1PGP7_DOTSN|nr:hypothetical protein DOTSEDRAFT_27149 [Dothistroma septosporum NZE10]